MCNVSLKITQPYLTTGLGRRKNNKKNRFERKSNISCVCVSMSKIAQAEYKAKARFQALLRRSRFSRRSLNDRRRPAVSDFRQCKVRHKKAAAERFFRRCRVFESFL